MTDLLDKAGSGSVEPEDFNAVVDAIESGPTGKVTAADIDSLAAQDGDVLTADGAGNATWDAGGGSQPFTPTDLDDLALWLDASDASTINAGSPADDDPVSAWADKSGKGYDAAQATSDNQPVYKTAVQNGLAVVRFDATENLQYLGLSGAGLDLFRNLDGFTIALAASQDVNAANGSTSENLTAGIDSVEAAVEFFLASFDAQVILIVRQAAGEGSVRDLLVAQIENQGKVVRTLFGCMDYVADSLYVGASEPYGIPNTGEHALVPGPSPDAAADNINVGALPSSNEGMTGDYCELVVYQRVLNAQERRQLVEYLSAKWATP